MKEFWNSVACEPPAGITARDAESDSANASDTKSVGGQDISPRGLEYTCEAAMLRRDRHPPPILSEGQAVFWRYSVDMFTSLLHFSLAGGFASARIMSVLNETGYLTSNSRDATYRRLMETTLALIDFMGDMTPLTGAGWRSAVRVRLLHAQVRVRILGGKARLNTYSVQRDGVPINQEDLAATLGGFCLAPLWCQKRLGIRLSPQEELAFLATWRHIGYYLGISPHLLQTYFNTAGKANASHAHRFFACVAFHLFTPSIPKNPRATPTYTILHAVAHRPPNDKTTGFHCELSRFLLGPGLANQLAIPRGTWADWLAVQQHGWTSWLTASFSAVYRPQWEVQRQNLFRRVMYLIVCWQLGERRSTFTYKEQKDHEKKVSELEQMSKEAGEGAGVEFGLQVGKQVRSQARWLFVEMGVVVAGLGVISTLSVWHICKTAYRFVLA